MSAQGIKLRNLPPIKWFAALLMSNSIVARQLTQSP